ncbi:hypothetical protein FGIG_10684 [Fasciola gigantica]|uniref:Uncharacterized protein n=1 Tax=Fasciola gigantica TaxID=46835 RepID=A0A504WSM7_FASGI|nr:hypothetical protein FGIG_10684 [Fasciola gigantica]
MSLLKHLNFTHSSSQCLSLASMKQFDLFLTNGYVRSQLLFIYQRQLEIQDCQTLTRFEFCT